MSALVRSIACPINLTPACLTVDVPMRGQENAGRLVLGIVTRSGGGVACGDYGLELDECVVKKMQFAFKTTHVFSTPVSFKTGLVP